MGVAGVSGPGRFQSLDGLRGVAASATFINHLALLSPLLFAVSRPPSWHSSANVGVKLLAWTPLRVFWDGTDAVLLFYVLSGFVLSLRFWAGVERGYGRFVLTRVARIYPVYVLSIVAAFLLRAGSMRREVPGLTPWFQALWRSEIGLWDPVKAMLCLPSSVLSLNAPLWTLIHEMRLSLALPFILMVMKRNMQGCLVLCTAVSLAANGALQYAQPLPGPVADLLVSGSFLWLFAVGAAAAKHHERVCARIADMGRAPQAGLLIIGIMLLTSRWTLPVPAVPTVFATGAGALLILLLSLSAPPLRALLTTRPVHFLGRISYPLYALHLPILLAFLYGLPGLGLAIRLLAAVPTCLVCAWLVTRFIELPVIEAWKKSLKSRAPRELHSPPF
jgi:peptidoglycan/LPS O-acetylase OafA/YrhL